MQNLCLLQCKKKLLELQNKPIAFSVDISKVFNGTIFLNKCMPYKWCPYYRRKINLYNIPVTSQLHEVLWLNGTSVGIFRMKSAQCMNICHFFKVDELLKLHVRTVSEFSLLNTQKVSCCIYFCAMINLMNYRRKYVSFFFYFPFSLFLFKYYSIIILIKKRGISGHLVQMRTKK